MKILPTKNTYQHFLNPFRSCQEEDRFPNNKLAKSIKKWMFLFGPNSVLIPRPEAAADPNGK